MQTCKKVRCVCHRIVAICDPRARYAKARSNYSAASLCPLCSVVTSREMCRPGLTAHLPPQKIPRPLGSIFPCHKLTPTSNPRRGNVPCSFSSKLCCRLSEQSRTYNQPRRGVGRTLEMRCLLHNVPYKRPMDPSIQIRDKH